MATERIRIAYRPDPTTWLAALMGLPYPCLLDSNDRERGRYHIITAAPSQWVSLESGQLHCHGPELAEFQSHAPDAELCWQALRTLHRPGPADETEPFSGGVVGYLGYDFGAWDLLGAPLQAPAPLPHLWAGRYEWALVADTLKQRAELVFTERCSADTRARVVELLGDSQLDASSKCELPAESPAFHPLQADVDKARYLRDIQRVQEYIRSGDCYQINYTQRFSAEQTPDFDALTLYRRLRLRQSAPFAAFLGLSGNRNLLSFSPERLVRVDPGGRVLAQPIKGTLPRGTNTGEDRALAAALRASAKDQAENLMIVDLLRNDLSRVCEINSVKVPTLFELQSFTNVHHLVSTVAGQLQASKSPLDLLRACFPGGSVTGAPKRRAMEIIQELEAEHRSAYCGSVFYWSDSGQLDANITIRTLVHNGNRLFCWAGGGITIDSDPESEYRESLDKISRLRSHE